MKRRKAGPQAAHTQQMDRAHTACRNVLIDAIDVFQHAGQSLPTSFDHIATCVTRHVADGCAIFRPDGVEPRLHLEAIQHREQHLRTLARAIVEDEHFTRDNPLLMPVLQTPARVRIIGAHQYRAALADNPHAMEYIATVGLRGILLARLYLHDHADGVLAIWRDGNGAPFTRIERTMSLVLASQISLAMREDAATQAQAQLRRERDMAHALLDTVLDTAPVGIAFYDTNLRVVRANAYLVNHSTISPEESRGKHIATVIPDLIPSVASQVQQVIDEDRALTDVEMSGKLPGEPDTPRYWRTSHYPVHLPGGELLGVSAITVDITAQKLADDELRQSLKHAEELASAEQEARKAAEQAAAIRDDFLAIASHELRTPLTTIKATAQLLDRRLNQPEVDLERAQRYTALLLREIERLATLVDDLLNATQIQRGHLRLRPERVDLVDLARQVLARFEDAPERTEQHEVRFIAPKHLPAWLDPGRIDQVLTNLISNALKYSPEGGEVRIVIQKSGEHAEITVHDHGMGMSQEELRKLFQPFARSALIRQTVSGSGLGLYIADRIVAQHGGSISVESQPDLGSTFQVQLPLIARNNA